jgi:hypothetical protein
MLRWFAGIAAILLFVVGAVLLFQSNAAGPALPPAPQPRLAAQLPGQLSPIAEAPVADPNAKEAKRFDRSDKNEDGRITLAELVEPRRKAFAKLDANSDGRLSFEEWAVKSIDKFEGADADRNQALTRAEFATTAPKPRPKKPDCACA